MPPRGPANLRADKHPGPAPPGLPDCQLPQPRNSPIAWYTVPSNASMIFLWEESRCREPRECVVGSSAASTQTHPISRIFSCSAVHLTLSASFSFCVAPTCADHTPELAPVSCRAGVSRPTQQTSQCWGVGVRWVHGWDTSRHRRGGRAACGGEPRGRENAARRRRAGARSSWAQRGPAYRPP